MIYSIIIITISFIWLGYETDWMRVRLLVGKDLPQYGVGRTLKQWDEYYRIHAKEIEAEKETYRKKQAHIKSHTCPVCHKYNYLNCKKHF